MKIKGREIKGPNIETIVIPRGDDVEDYLVFRAQAVLDYTEFDALCPRPTPPVKIVKGGARVADPDAPPFIEARKNYNIRRFSWMVLKSLEATEGLEWETIEFGNPATWENYEKEFKDGGLTDGEIAAIVTAVLTANSMNTEKLDQAREAFLAFQAAQQET